MSGLRLNRASGATSPRGLVASEVRFKRPGWPRGQGALGGMGGGGEGQTGAYLSPGPPMLAKRTQVRASGGREAAVPS
jgi:hypothetical protein